MSQETIARAAREDTAQGYRGERQSFGTGVAGLGGGRHCSLLDGDRQVIASADVAPTLSHA